MLSLCKLVRGRHYGILYIVVVCLIFTLFRQTQFGDEKESIPEEVPRIETITKNSVFEVENAPQRQPLKTPVSTPLEPGTTPTAKPPEVEIPHRIHQTYKSERIVARYMNQVTTWIKKHPTWEYWFWSDSDIRALLQDHYWEYLDLFENYTHSIQRADVARYFILYHYGGVYVDLDFVSHRPLDDFLKGKQCILVPEPSEQSLLLYDLPRVVTNSIMASVPRHQFFKTVIKGLQSVNNEALRKYKKDPGKYIVFSTGPNMLENTLQGFSQNCSLCNIHIAKSRELVPTTDIGQVGHFRHLCGLMMKNRRRSRRTQYRNRVLPRANHVEVLKRRACISLDVANPIRYALSRPRLAYAEHMWYHLGYSPEKAAKLKHVNLTQEIQRIMKKKVERYIERRRIILGIFKSSLN